MQHLRTLAERTSREDVTRLVTEPVSFVDAQCAPQAIIATLLGEYGLRARERTEAGLGRFERLAVRHAIFSTDD